METPSSSRSQNLAAFRNSIRVSKGKNGEFASKTRTRNGKQIQERSALNELTNDSSPIVGVAMETPSSGVGNQRGNGVKNNMTMTPGCGEALLSGQVKTLLQKVTELWKIPLESSPFVHLQSPMALLAPTPENTPHVQNLSGDGGLGSTVMDILPVVGEQFLQMASRSFDGMSADSQKSAITRSLLLDFAEKSYTGENSATKEKADDIDNTFEEMGDEYYEEDDIDDDDGLVDELCEGLNKMNVTGMFAGKHMRFVYNSDGEIEGEEEECGGIEDCSTRLKGLPTPKGKHLRFPLED